MSEKKISIIDLANLFIRKIGFKEINGIEQQILRFWRGDFYLWKDGVYWKISGDEVKALMVKILAGGGQIATTGLLDNLKLHIMAGTILGQDRVPDTWISDSSCSNKVPVGGIVLNNGILMFIGDKTELKTLTPDYFCLGKLPYDYDPEAKCEKWLGYLEKVTKGDTELQRMLRQWAGYLLLPGQKYQSFLLLIGEAGMGKGTFARAMKAMLGSDNCSDVPLRRFTDRFALYQTYGKKLNIVGDAEQELTPQGEAVIKTWTGEDGLDYERKYGEGFSAMPTAKLMILANDFPTFTDKSMGTWRRMKIVPIHRDDPTVVERGLEDAIREEMPGVLNWAIAGLMDLEEQEGFTVPVISQNFLEMHREESNPARMFLKENYRFDLGSPFGVSRQSIYEEYVKWCNAKGYQRMSDKTFGKEVRREFPLIKEGRMGSRGNRYRIHIGLYVRPDAEIL